MTEERFASAFGSAADEYERGRPGYPVEAIDTLARELSLGPDSAVVDLAAGTGKLTRELVGRFGRVVAIEPLAEMREQLEQQVPGAETIDGTAERIPLADESADAVLVAQAFHWFDGRRALDEIARVLRPGGGLGLLWNTTPWETRETPWFALLDDLLERRRVDLAALHRNASGLWRRAFDDDRRFEPLADATFENPQLMARDEFLDGFASRSYVAVLEPEDRNALLAEVVELLGRADAPVDQGQVLVPMRTATFWTRLTVAR
ncbi:MAG: methyltransferase domain-containing protein [Solirubrobacterales bacterium]